MIMGSSIRTLAAMIAGKFCIWSSAKYLTARGSVYILLSQI